MERMQASGDWNDAGRLLAEAAQGLEHGGAELLVLCTNTMHKVADAITAATDLPFVHIADVTAAAVRAAGLRQVGLLATGYTMEQPFLRDRLESHGLSVLVPEVGRPRRGAPHHLRRAVRRPVVTEPSREVYRGVIRRLVDEGAEGIILGCTEIELLVGQDDSAVPVFPTTRLHVEAAIAAAL